MSSITMSAAVERGMRSASVEFAREVIGQLSSEGVLKCSLDDAIKMFDFDSVAVVSSRSKASKKREIVKTNSAKKASKITAKPTVILPFCGHIEREWCEGVKLNFGLHTQCTMGRCGEDTYCKTCRKHADNSATGKPPYGDINDRAKFDVDYRDPKGKLTLPYANVAEKQGISMEAAVAAAATMGWTIPAAQLVKRTSKRGRPGKSAEVSDSDSDTEETKKRGRPSKEKVEAPTQEDQIAQLVAEAYAETTTVVKTVVKTKPVVKTEPVVKTKKVKKPTPSDEQKEQAKLAKKESADKLKADKAALILAKKEAALKLKEEKLVGKALEKEAKEAAAEKVKSEKKSLALKARQEKAASKKVERKTAKLLKTEDEKAETSDEVVFSELEEEAVDSSDEMEAVDSSGDEMEEETELSETMTVGDVEYFFIEQDGQTVLFTKTGEPVGIYDAATDTVQEAEFAEE